MMYSQRRAYSPEQREANHRGMFRCIVLCFTFMVTLGGVQALLTSCQRKAYAPRNNPKPRHIGLIRDREMPQPRYSPYVWAEDTTSLH